jgi:hypothetical protein
MISRGERAVHKRERADQRAAQREHDGQRHRPKHLPLDFLESQDRQVNDDDNADREDDWPQDLAPSVKHLARHRALRMLVVGEAAEDVLHHDDRAVDDESEIACAEAHQVA